MTTATKLKLWKAQFLPTSDTELYAAPENAHCQIQKVVLVNVDASTAYNATIFHNISSETGSDVNALVLELELQPKESITVTELTGIILNPTERIVAKADTADKITAHGYGTELVQ